MTFSAFCRGRKDDNTTSPGMYNIPSTFGVGPKYSFRSRPKDFLPEYAPKYRTLPSTLSHNGISLGSKEIKQERRIKKEESCPPLNSIPSTIGNGPKMSIHNKYGKKTEVTPGPGQYDVKAIKSDSSIVVGVGKRYYYIVDKDLEEVNSYMLPSAIQVKSSLEHRNIIPRKTKFQKQQHPGPIYNIEKPLGYDARKTSFPKGSREKTIPETPGPGDYEISRDIMDHSKLGTSMHIRTEARADDVTRAPYYDIPTTIVPRKVSMLSRPVTSYETPSPGPAYNIPSTIVPKKVSIGEKLYPKNPNVSFPGPDAYFQSDSPKDISADIVCPLDGSYNKDIINYKEVKKIPGPGQYDPIVFDKTKEIGFTISSKEYDTTTPDTAAPYRLLKSTLSGPSFTIGDRNV